MRIRLSYGTAVKMGLKKGKMKTEPTTAYIMLGDRCKSNCSFCTQARSRDSSNFLSRILWIDYPPSVLKNLHGFSRICFQTLDYDEVVDDLIEVHRVLPKIPVSVSIVPISREDMLRLKKIEIDTISIALDAANEKIFDEVKGNNVRNRFTWDSHWDSLRKAKEIFENVNTHLIVGLGESDEDLISVMLRLYKMGITTALFAYTPVVYGKFPDVGRYRAIQVARYLIYQGYEDFYEVEDGKIVELKLKKYEREILRGLPFLTSGCPGCNRPYYNERPSGKIYNYPRILTGEEIKKAVEDLKNYCHVEL